MSGLVGEVLLMGVVIVAIGLISLSVYSYLTTDPGTPHIEVDGVANMRTNEIHLKHQGGDSIEGDNLRVLINVNGTLLDPYDDNSPARWGLSDKGIGNFDRWTLGKILVLDTMPEVDITEDDEIRVTLVSLSSSRVIMSGEVFGGLFGNATINIPPIADAGDDLTDGLCENTTWAEVGVWFDGSGSYDPDNPHDNTDSNYRGIVSWHWDFGDGNESDGMWVWHNYSVIGNHTVKLTVTDVEGATDTDTCIVTIRPPAKLTADAGPEQWIGVGTEVRFDGSGSTGCIKEWIWEFGDGTNATVNASTTTHTYSEERDYIVNLTVVEDHSGKTANDTTTIHAMSGFKIVDPRDGSVVIDASDPVTIDARAFDIKVDYVNFNISSISIEADSSTSATDYTCVVVAPNTTSYTHDWNTAILECGNYTINATAYNANGAEVGTDNITVCVCNTPDLMGFWRFDDGTGSKVANDSSCNRNHGSIKGSPKWITDGILHALRLNGSEYIEVANSTSLAIANKTTIGVWANSSDAGEQYILAKGGVGFELEDGVVGQYVSNINTTAFGWDTKFGKTYRRAQTFELDGDVTLTEVGVYIKKANSGVNRDVWVAIHKDGVNKPGARIELVIVKGADIGTSYTWINRTFNCILSGGTTYWLVLRSPTASRVDDYYWGACHPDYYVNGESWYYDGSSWGQVGLLDVDMAFELSTTPAPSTYTDRISMPDSDNFKFIAYYGWINCTNLDWAESGLELVLVRDDNEEEIQKVRNTGVDVYFYIEIGQSYCEYNHDNNTEIWQKDLISHIDNHTYVDGFFFDDLDPAFWTANISKCGTCNTSDLNERLTDVITHIHDNNQKAIANGVRYYADHCGSDYYMWESFMGTHDTSGAYFYDDFFNGTASSGKPWGNNSTDWINGVKKYEYLRDKGVLNKTLAHCYGPPDDDNRSIYGYIASRVLGLKGFSYVDTYNFASKPLRLADGLKWDLGTRMSYDIDADAGNLSGRFTNGVVVDWVNQTVAANDSTYTTDLISDPLTAHLLNSSTKVTGMDLCLIRGQVDFMHGVLRSSTDITGWNSWHQNATAKVILDAGKGTATLYVDGVHAANRTFPMGLPFDFTGSNLTIGANNAGAYGFNGSIEEVLIYDS